MARKKLEILVRELGMETELSALFDTDRYDHKFEQAVAGCLDNRAFRKISPSILVNESSWRHTRNYTSDRILVTKAKYVSYGKFLEAATDFKQFYGICCEEKTQTQIAKDQRITNATVRKRVDYVVQVLRQYDRRDIWGKTL